MSRPFRGQESMAAAVEAVKGVTTVELLRRAQAVLPLCCSVTLEQTALVIRRVILPPKRRSKKLPETLQRIKAEWEHGASLR